MLGEDCLNCSFVVGVSGQEGQVSLHASLGQLVHAIELLPELLFEGLSALIVELNCVEAKFVHHSHGCLVASIFLEVVKLTLLCHDPDVEAWSGLHTNEFLEGIGIVGTNLSSFDSVGESQVECVVSVVLPDTEEVWLIGQCRCLLMREDQVFFLDQFGGELAKVSPFLLEGGSSFLSGGVDAEVNFTVLVGVGEGVETAVLLTLVILIDEVVTTVAPPGLNSVQLGNFIVE